MTQKFPFMLPSEQQWSDYLKQNNIKLSTRVVLYENIAGQPYWATRVYWMFRIFGHQHVSVLNGGFKKWSAEGRPTETTENLGTEEEYKAVMNKDMYRTFE